MVNRVKKLFEYQEIRFLFVGVLNTIVGYGSFLLLLLVGTNYLVANTISYAIGVIHSYIWNRKFTFKSKNKSVFEIIKFVLVYIVNYLIGLGALYILVDKLNINPYLAGAFNLIITTLISFFGHKYFSFRQKNFTIADKEIESVKKYKNLIIYIGLFGLYFILLLALKNLDFFADEADNMLGGITLANGGSIYKDFPSQHMPFMYYLMSIFIHIGIKGTIPLRICFYFLLSLIWVLIYKRYNEKIGKWPLFLYPIFYIFMISNYQYGHCVLADHIEAQCMVVLLIELYLFNKNKKLLKYSDLFIGLSIYISIWSAFVSVIPIIFIVIAFFTVDIKKFINISNKEKNSYFKYFIKEYYRILIFAIVPFIISMIPIIVSGSLSSFFEQAFYINLKIYPKYNLYSPNIIKTFLKVIYNYFNYMLSLIKTIPSDLSLIPGVIFFVFNFIFVIKCKCSKILTISLFLFILMCGNREIYNFHAIPYFSVSIMAFLLIYKNIENKKILYLIIMISLFILVVRYIPSTKNILKRSLTPNYEIDKKLTKSNNYIYYYDFATYKYIDSGIKPASRFVTIVPWFSELYEKDIIEEVKRNKPNVIYYSPVGNIWNYEYKDFAKNMDMYIKKNYTYVSQYKFWIMNDYIDEAEKILNMKIADYTTSYNKSFHLNPLLDNTTFEQVFKADNEKIDSIEVRFKTYGRINYSLIKFSILDDDKVLKEIIISADELNDEQYYKFKFDDVYFERNKDYKIKIQSINATNYDNVTIYCTEDNDEFDDNYALINGINKKYDFDMNIYYGEVNYYENN